MQIPATSRVRFTGSGRIGGGVNTGDDVAHLSDVWLFNFVSLIFKTGWVYPRMTKDGGDGVGETEPS
ncbi:protein of unknown function [Thermococcus camini]|uniref:Uncharacterized protein n=1 Tax=Thermococcus camini TaxID=2016373 RepID=A0A7G2D4Y5_9EURY|nr:protein of unknown function [Thermococcus camini]